MTLAGFFAGFFMRITSSPIDLVVVGIERRRVLFDEVGVSEILYKQAFDVGAAGLAIAVAAHASCQLFGGVEHVGRRIVRFFDCC